MLFVVKRITAIMTHKIERIQPVKSDDGIVFYISADGTQAGISISGLEKLLGYSSSSMLFNQNQNKLLWRMVNDTPCETDPELLKPVWNKVFNPSGVGTDGARIVTEEATVAIITYYAVERNNIAAMKTLSVFAQKGFNLWVKEVTHFAIDDKQNEIINLLKNMSLQIENLQVKVEKIDRLEGTTVRLFPGLHQINSGIIGINPALLEDGAVYSPRDWLRLKEIELDQSTYRCFALLVSETYKTLTGHKPDDKYKKVKSKDKLVTRREGYGYKVKDFDILEAAFTKLLEKVELN